MKLNFARDAWSMDGLTHAYSSRFTATPEFEQQDDCIINPIATEGGKDDYSYISLVTREPVTPGVRLTTHCTFHGLAAPLVVMAKDLYEENGILRYSDYLEVVIWKHGLNVWELWRAEDGIVKYKKLLGLSLPMEEAVVHELITEVQEDHFRILLDGREILLRCDKIYPRFHLGITGCEGLCRFYDMEIQSPETN